MARPTKAEIEAKKALANKGKSPDFTEVDIDKLDEALSIDAEKASGFQMDDEVLVEDNEIIPEPTYPNEYVQNNDVVNNEQTHKFEMPPSETDTVSQNDDIPDDSSSKAYDIPDENYNPLEEKIKERDYTHFAKPNTQNVDSNNVIQPEPIIPEPVNVIPPIDDAVIEDGKSNNTEKPTEPSVPKRPSINPDLQDLTPSQKRKAAEVSADAILLAYGQFAPMPFKMVSTYQIKPAKIENLHYKGDLNKDMVVDHNSGMTLIDYCEGKTNAIEGIFDITQKMKEDIKTPLVEVLLENNFALTPTQQLIAVVGMQLGEMGIKAFSIMMETKNDMKEFKRMHKENREDAQMLAKSMEMSNKKQEVKEQPIMEYRTEPVVEYRTATSKQKEEVYEPTEDVSNDIPSEKTKKVNDYLGNDSSITIEEVPNN